MSKMEEVKLYVNEKLQAAAVEILIFIEKTIADYEDQATCLKRQTDRQRSLLDILLRPRLPQNEVDLPAAHTTPHSTSASSGTGYNSRSFARPCHSNGRDNATEPQCLFTSREDFINYVATVDCPYCCKKNMATQKHLISRHYLFAIHFIENGIGKFVIPCACRETINGRSHWHCPNCGKTIYRKNNFEAHLSNKHGVLLQQQNKDTAADQPSVSFWDKEGPAEHWWQDMGGVSHEDLEPLPSLHIKEEHQEVRIAPEIRQSQAHSEIQCCTPLDVSELVQIKQEQNEVCEDWVGEQYQGVDVGDAGKSEFTISHVESLSKKSLSTFHVSKPSNRESVDCDAASSLLRAPLDAHIKDYSSKASESAAIYQRVATEDTDGGRTEDWRKKFVEKLTSQKAKAVKKHYRHISMKTKKHQSMSSRSAVALFRCKVCGKAFHYKYTLKKHAQVHALDKLFLCGVCGEKYKTLRALVQHEKTHSETNSETHLEFKSGQRPADGGETR